MADIALQLCAIACAVAVGAAFRLWIELPLWVCAMLAAGGYLMALLAGAFLLWRRKKR